MILIGTLVVWVVVLAAVAVVLWRDVLLMERRLVFAGGSAANGLEIGAAVSRRLPHADAGLVVFLGDTCDVCFDVAEQLSYIQAADELVIVVVPHGGAGDALAELLPEEARVVRGEAAEVWSRAFDVHVAPFAVHVENGVVVGKGHLRGAGDVDALTAVTPSEARR
jgi:hypothetical protein